MRTGLRRRREGQEQFDPEVLLKKKPVFHGVASMGLERYRLAPSTDFQGGGARTKLPEQSVPMETPLDEWTEQSGSLMQPVTILAARLTIPEENVNIVFRSLHACIHSLAKMKD